MSTVIAKGGVKPTGKTFRGKSDLGNGDPCPTDPEAHGKMYVLPSGKEWCPHVDHSSGKRRRDAE